MTPLERLIAAIDECQHLLEEMGDPALLADEDDWTCDTCSWWTRSSDEPSAVFGRCRLASEAPVKDPKFVTAYGPGAQAPSGELRTSEDFSCSQYTGTPTPDA